MSTKLRCYNCSKYGHISTDCKLPKREKGICFKCEDEGHIASNCKSESKCKLDFDQINCVSVWQPNHDFQKLVTLKMIDNCGTYNLKVDALIDTGSPISLSNKNLSQIAV